MSGSEQRKTQKTPVSVSVAALANNLDTATSDPLAIRTESTSSHPVVLIWDPTAAIPQLVKIETVCSMLAIGKSAAYELVANGDLRPPLKFGTSRRAASRWLLSDVVDFIQTLSANRPVPPTAVRATSGVADRVRPKLVAATKKTRQVHSLPPSIGGTMT
ncbi:helix-turn-helix transcriptional regulator [Rhodoferax sp.]|uniref:helix-turn-helix transcriptional regulator n=1 Tax=Rhodoferax sp. TaxID=50421 RepID=UPI00276F4E85|nr:hypothetical protein [Rhodoferax sp.]